jgi:hypothetical protein
MAQTKYPKLIPPPFTFLLIYWLRGTLS